MKLRYVFPVTGTLALADSWRVKTGDLEFEFVTDKGAVTALWVTIVEDDRSKWPQVARSSAPGIKASIVLPESDSMDRVREHVRTLQGMLSIYSLVAIDTVRFKREWLPDSEEEREALQLRDFTEQRAVHSKFPLEFDLVARSVLRASKLEEYQTALSFFRRARLDADDEQYIDAFYGFFFFLETLYGEGKFKSDQLVEKFQAQPGLLRVAEEEAANFRLPLRCPNDFSRFIATKPQADAIIRKLVERRGFLHHHSPRRSGMWHPERQMEFEAEAGYLQMICFKLAHGLVKDEIFNPDAEKEYFQMAQEAGAIFKFKITFCSIDQRGVREDGRVANFSVAGTKAHYRMITEAERAFRQQFEAHEPLSRLVSYECRSADGSTVFSEYRNLISPP